MADDSPMSTALSQGASMSPDERDLFIRTLYGEAGNQGADGQAAVAHVIRNRLNAGDWGSDLTSVIKAPKQFSLWNAGDPAGASARRLDPNSSSYQNLGNIVDGVMGGKIADPTGGADHYYNPSVADPDWGDKLGALNDVTIGAHRFVGKARNYAGGASDLPATDAQPAMGHQTPAIAAVMAANQPPISQALRSVQEDPNASMWDKFKDGGPGALLGMPSARPWDLGSALTGMGISAMARDNPSGASAMATVPAMEARMMQPKFGINSYNQATGKGIIVNNRTGQAGQQQIGEPFQQISDKAIGDFNERDAAVRQSSMNMDQLRLIQQQIANKEFDPGLLTRGSAYIDSLAGSSNPAEQKLYNASHWLSLYHQDFLKHQTGTQTDKDAENAQHALMPGNSEYDPALMLQAIDNIRKSEGTRLQSNIIAQRGSIGRYKGQIPTGDYANDYDKIEQGIQKSDQDFEPQKQSFLKGHYASSAAPAPAAPVSKFAAGNNGSTSHAMDFTQGGPISPEDAAKLPSGALFKTTDGRTLRRP